MRKSSDKGKEWLIKEIKNDSVFSGKLDRAVKKAQGV